MIDDGAMPPGRHVVDAKRLDFQHNWIAPKTGFVSGRLTSCSEHQQRIIVHLDCVQKSQNPHLEVLPGLANRVDMHAADDSTH